MKIALFLIVLLPMAFAMSERSMVSDLMAAAAKLIHLNELKSVVQTIVDNIGTDKSEAECESACPSLFHNAIGVSGCKIACKGASELAHHFHIVPTK